MKPLLIIALTFLVFASGYCPQDQPQALTIARDMIKVISEISTLKMNMESVERIDDQYVTVRFKIKRRHNPLEIYYYRTFPDAGVEVLLNRNSKGKLWVNPGGFPWTTLELDIHSPLVRDKQHHSIYEAGFEYFTVILSGLLKKYATELNTAISYIAKEKIGNKNCHKIKFDNKNYKLYDYKTIQIETPLTLAAKLKISEYKILELNTSIKSFQTKIPAGTLLKLPNDYAKEMILWIEEKTSLPVKMEISDEKGLYEKYSFADIIINPEFATNEFEKTFKEYHFK
ncbi:MAG: hypothetical protein CVU05_01155 [Bacteroidetes bacterium HGW-Bacteroidetes-21]|jgi:outer membrane lipoprotein-sorting protein|nr:MAG: hypothetical protein CVU05_01155 [Bacteroidetes bacterium HGW-Bacteroidetes-21]